MRQITEEEIEELEKQLKDVETEKVQEEKRLRNDIQK